MSSLADESHGDANAMNLHQRVIKSGLDSVTGPDAERIVLLFEGCCVFMEDQVVCSM